MWYLCCPHILKSVHPCFIDLSPGEHVRLNPKGGDLSPDRLHRGENLVKGCIGANVQIVPSDLGLGV